MPSPGPRNLITDVPGLRVGNAHDADLRSGVTVILPDAPAVAAVDVRGGGPGTRETRALEPETLVSEIHGLVFSGGSAYGLDSGAGAQSYLREQGRGFRIGEALIPIVPTAILFDLLNGGNKDWGRHPPYREIAYRACEAADHDFALGTAGAGTGATTVNLKGGLGSASLDLGGGLVIGALAAVNAAGGVTFGDTPYFRAAAVERNSEFGGLGFPTGLTQDMETPRLKGAPGENTTLGLVAVNARLDKPQAKRLAVMAAAGLARAIHPVFSPIDGDIVFAMALGGDPLADPVYDLARLGAHAANALARAVARGVFEAAGFPGDPAEPPAWRDVHSPSA